MSTKRKLRRRRVPTLPKPVGTGDESGQDDTSGPLEIPLEELEAILKRAQSEPLQENDYRQLHSVVMTLMFLTQELEKKRVSVQRLKQLLFGPSTEKTDKVLSQAGSGENDPGQDNTNQAASGDESSSAPENNPDPEKTPTRKVRGHGRNGARSYTGARKVKVAHPELKPGDLCPECRKGHVYETSEPGRLVRLTGQAPLNATVYELQKLRCNLCNRIFTAPAPAEAGEDKYDASSASLLALLKYGSGVPFNRLEGLQGNMGIPLPAATQWEIVRDCAAQLQPVYEELIRQAAQGQLLHNDDTTMKVLDLPAFAPADGRQDPGRRKGVFTSGIVSVLDEQRIALFFTGHQHAGENLAALLQQRSGELPPPIQMCDALSRNLPEEFQTILSNCLVHGRRRFVELMQNFPQECRYVLEILKEVYINDAEAKSRGFSPEERLHWHQEHSGPKMAELKSWLSGQFEQHRVEPNSSLGEAIAYMLKHWEALTLFLRVPGAPLDNNICERALKKAILHRKNACFYKTQNGSRVGDLFMSMIHTCELNGVNPCDYLTELQKHASELAANPAAWLPWNYHQQLEKTRTLTNG